MSTSIEPPREYWASLTGVAAPEEVERLRKLSEARLNEFTADSALVVLLERMVADEWLRHEKRYSCPNCDEVLTADEAAGTVCPHCTESFAQHGGVIEETIYVRHLATPRVVDWVVAIHGMNTTGAWQEAFSWLIGTTWGRSVPVAAYKYGIVIPGVIMPWRRAEIRDELRMRIAMLRDQAIEHGFSGKPDFVAHSFGTWLIGHLLEKELEKPVEERLCFGRVILAGCVLRPDFDWKRFKDAELVEDVLNHYGTKDPVVPFAHATIFDSGPSGRRGFDGSEVLNIRAEGYGHSDIFAIDRKVDGLTHLEQSYRRYWRPFLTLPGQELNAIPDRVDPATPWHPLPWPLRGTLFPVVALPLLIALFAFLIALIGIFVAKASVALRLMLRWSAIGLGALLALTAIVIALRCAAAAVRRGSVQAAP